jgi:hypothetical protein
MWPWLIGGGLLIYLLLNKASSVSTQAPPPGAAVKLAFIHHSVGENWLKPDGGDLRAVLNANNYYVVDTNYEWGPDAAVGANYVTAEKIGDRTDIGQWYDWFLGPQRDTYLNALYNDKQLTDSAGLNTITDPGGEASVVMFKSCFSQGAVLTGNPDDAPLAAGQPNPIHGQSISSNEAAYTVANVKGLYRDLLTYFTTRQDKLFIIITPPPSDKATSSAENMSALRGVATWLATQLLVSYPYRNVRVFDFSTVMTGGHHTLQGRVLGPTPYLVYTSPGPDNHPTPAGSQLATTEFVPLLNAWYHCWKGTGAC